MYFSKDTAAHLVAQDLEHISVDMPVGSLETETGHTQKLGAAICVLCCIPLILVPCRSLVVHLRPACAYQHYLAVGHDTVADSCRRIGLQILGYAQYGTCYNVP